jgi:hypothetical protein
MRYGKRRIGESWMKIPDYPESSLQSFVDKWWEQTETTELRRGRLIRAFLPHVDQIPYALVVQGRAEATDHTKANYRIEPLRIRTPPSAPRLPVAGLPNLPGEARVALRAKKRPALILSMGGSGVPPDLRGGSSANWMTAPTLLVAPYYGAEANQKRAGWKPRLVDRIRHCEFPQYLWDKLPIDGAEFSILRFDHLQPIGHHHETWEVTNYCLSQDALSLVDEWLRWLITGGMDPQALLMDVREGLLKLLRVPSGQVTAPPGG